MEGVKSATISVAFRRALEDQRETLNSIFRARLKQGAKIDPHVFAEHVRLRIGPNIAAIDLVSPDRIRLALFDLVEVSLELFAAGHIGEGTKTPHLSMLWQERMPNLARHLAREPRRVAGSLSNALIQIEAHSVQAAERWLNLLAKSSEYTNSVDELLTLGKASAWVAGMSHLRNSALSAIRSLPTDITRQLLDLDPEADDVSVSNYLTHLKEDPWCNGIDDMHHRERKVLQVGRCGGFRGFGGVMLAPPTVATIDGILVVSDGQNVWRIFADRFGSVTQRIDWEPFQQSQPPPKSNPLVSKDGTIAWDQSKLSRPDLASSTSFAFDGKTLAITVPTSFYVFLFAKTSMVVPSIASKAGS